MDFHGFPKIAGEVVKSRSDFHSTAPRSAQRGVSLDIQPEDVFHRLKAWRLYLVLLKKSGAPGGPRRSQEIHRILWEFGTVWYRNV